MTKRQLTAYGTLCGRVEQYLMQTQGIHRGEAIAQRRELAALGAGLRPGFDKGKLTALEYDLVMSALWMATGAPDRGAQAARYTANARRVLCYSLDRLRSQHGAAYVDKIVRDRLHPHTEETAPLSLLRQAVWTASNRGRAAQRRRATQADQAPESVEDGI